MALKSVSRRVVATLLVLGPACSNGDSAPSMVEALQQPPPEAAIKPKDPPKAPPSFGPPPPTDAEFAAWNRKNPEGEKALYKWDKANADRLLRYWEELSCFREAVMEAGQKAFGAEPGSPVEEQWFQFKRAYVAHVNGWQQRLFANEPRVLEKSKFVSNLLEAHEHVMNNYPKAYNMGDKTDLELVETQWTIVEQRTKKYMKNLGVEWIERDPNNAKQMAAHKKVCDKALAPPDRSGKRRKPQSKGLR